MKTQQAHRPTIIRPYNKTKRTNYYNTTTNEKIQKEPYDEKESIEPLAHRH